MMDLVDIAGAILANSTAPKRIANPVTLADVLHNAVRDVNVANSLSANGAERTRAHPSLAEWLIVVRAISDLSKPCHAR